jgi:hypothetical protein
MGRRYRRKNNSTLVAIVADVVHIASRLPWWGALLTGIFSYFIIAMVLGGYIESHIASQAGSKFHVITEVRFGRLVHVCHWVGVSCFIAGIFFTVRNYALSHQARLKEQGIVTIISKLIGRNVD